MEMFSPYVLCLLHAFPLPMTIKSIAASQLPFSVHSRSSLVCSRVHATPSASIPPALNAGSVSYAYKQATHIWTPPPPPNSVRDHVLTTFVDLFLGQQLQEHFDGSSGWIITSKKEIKSSWLQAIWNIFFISFGCFCPFMFNLVPFESDQWFFFIQRKQKSVSDYKLKCV